MTLLSRGKFGICCILSLLLHCLAASIFFGSAGGTNPEIGRPIEIQLVSVGRTAEKKQLRQSGEQRSPSRQKKVSRPEPVLKPVSKLRTEAKSTQARRASNSLRRAPGHAQSTQAFQFARATYEQMLLELLGRKKHYPRRARRLGIEGETQVVLRLKPSGELVDHRITKSSGSRILDREVLALITRSIPFPPLPAGYPRAEEFIIPVRFRLR